MKYLHIKRCFDIAFALFGVLTLLPVFTILAVLIKIDSKGPILFKQKRIGMNKKTFNIIKFRTMFTDSPINIPTHLLKNPEIHITRLGKILRRTSLDELPQLFNILVGEMSFVGPRPALWNQFDLIKQRDRLGVNFILPGVTGFAQINGRDNLQIKEKVDLDSFYVKNMSIFLDIKILILTIFKVINGKGYKEGSSLNKENR